MDSKQTEDRLDLIPLRWLVLVFVAFICAGVVAGLTWVTTKEPAAAGLAGVAAWASTLVWLSKHVS
jgi:hypothetical protein